MIEFDQQIERSAIDSTLEKATSYESYRAMVSELLEKGIATGGSTAADMVHYSMLNHTRMKRLDKTTSVLPEVATELGKIERKLTWLVITEGWCGDAAQIVPVLNKMAESTPTATLRFLLRDENLDLMDQFLTDGGRSIPIVILVDSLTKNVIGRWGPRPAVIQEMVIANKKASASIGDPDERKRMADEMKTDAQRWYTKDKTESIQREFLAQLLRVA